MICTLHKLLFWLLPLKRWQVFLIRFHFQKCPSCREESGVDESLNQVSISPRDCQDLPSVWPEIKKQIRLDQKKGARKKRCIPIPRWGWVLPVLGLVCLIIFFPFLTEKNDNSTISQDKKIIKSTSKIILKSVKLENVPAKTFFFQSSHPDRLIVWVQKHN
jgi:hypothetical protein